MTLNLSCYIINIPRLIYYKNMIKQRDKSLEEQSANKNRIIQTLDNYGIK